MMNRTIKYIFVLFSFLIWGSCKEDVEITRMDISSQADIDFICDNLPDGDTFGGDIIISTEEDLDYKCLSQLKHIKGDLIIIGPNSSLPFRNVESILGDEGLYVCDESVDTVSFPNLVTLNAGLGIGSACKFNNVFFFPKIETISRILVGGPIIEDGRSGTFLGFNNVEEINSIWIYANDNIDDESNNLKFDGFYNLKRINGQFNYQYLNDKFEITDKSFSRLEEVSILELRQLPDPEPKTDLTLQEIFPNLERSERVFLTNFPPENVCYLMDHYNSGWIEQLDVLSTVTLIAYSDEELEEICN